MMAEPDRNTDHDHATDYEPTHVPDDDAVVYRHRDSVDGGA